MLNTESGVKKQSWSHRAFRLSPAVPRLFRGTLLRLAPFYALTSSVFSTEVINAKSVAFSAARLSDLLRRSYLQNQQQSPASSRSASTCRQTTPFMALYHHTKPLSKSQPLFSNFLLFFVQLTHFAFSNGFFCVAKGKFSAQQAIYHRIFLSIKSHQIDQNKLQKSHPL